MHLVSDDDLNLWRVLQTVLLDVPADTVQDLVPRRGEAREVRHVRAGYEPDTGVAA